LGGPSIIKVLMRTPQLATGFRLKSSLILRPGSKRFADIQVFENINHIIVDGRLLDYARNIDS
jgi:hypothetical protein